MSVDPRTQYLFDAIVATNYDRVKRAIDSGVSVNSVDDRDRTPLAVATRQGNQEIIQLLLAAGAQIQAQGDRMSPMPVRGFAADKPVSSDSSPNLGQQSSGLIVPEDGYFQSIESELPESPMRDRSVVYEDLVDLIHGQPSQDEVEIVQVVPKGNRLISDPHSTADATIIMTAHPGHNNNLMAAAYQKIGSDAEATYTFDLEEVFAANHQSPNSVQIPPSNEQFNEELTITSLQQPSRNSQWDLSESSTSEARIDEIERSLETSQWEEGETYAIDLDDFDAPMSLFENFNPLDPRKPTQIIDTVDWAEGETYAIDLDDLGDLDLLGNLRDIDPQPYLVGDLANLEQPMSLQEIGDVGADFDDDFHINTDIHGESEADAEDEMVAPYYDENATNTSLMAAIEAGDLDLAAQAIEAKASLDRHDWQLGYSPLGMAIDRGHIDIVQSLLDAGANPHSGSISMTALGLAAERGELEIIQLLLPRGVDVNAPVGHDGWTALLSAIQAGHRAVVQLLVTAGAKVNIWSRGETPILLAAKCEEREIYNYLYPLVNTQIRLCADRDGEQLLQSTRKRRIRSQNRPVEKFIEMATAGNGSEVSRAIEFGIEIDAIGSRGHNALMGAAYYGHESVVGVLLANGADPNLLSDGYDGLGYGMTALMLAAGSFFASNRQAIVAQLLAAGADPNQQGAGGKTALQYAALHGSGYRACVETLIAAGADLNLLDDRGHTILTQVAAAENYEMFNLLLQAGASMTGLEAIQLIHAAKIGNVDRVKFLLASKVNLNLDRGAALCNAAAAGHTEIVDLLIRAGANVNLSNNSGFTPIACAAHGGYAQIVRLLVAAGADTQAPPGITHSYSALEYAQMGMYQFVGTGDLKEDRSDRQHAQIVSMLESLGES